MAEKYQTNQEEAIDMLMELYEKKNRELEEREMEARYRLLILENTMPALMMWNIWRMMLLTQGGLVSMDANAVPTESSMPLPNSISAVGTSQFKDGESDFGEPLDKQEEELIMKMKQLEDKLNAQTKVLANCREIDDSLRDKLLQLENWIVGETPQDPKDEKSIADVFEKLNIMAQERMEMDRRIRELELREKMFKDTLEQADLFINQMDTQYQTQPRGISPDNVNTSPLYQENARGKSTSEGRTAPQYQENARGKSTDEVRTSPQYQDYTRGRSTDEARTSPQYQENARGKSTDEVRTSPQYQENARGKSTDEIRTSPQYQENARGKSTDEARTSPQYQENARGKSTDEVSSPPFDPHRHSVKENRTKLDEVSELKDKVTQLEDEIEKLKEIVASSTQKDHQSQSHLEACIAELKCVAELLLEQQNSHYKSENRRLTTKSVISRKPTLNEPPVPVDPEKSELDRRKSRKMSTKMVTTDPIEPDEQYERYMEERNEQRALTVRDQPVSLLSSLSSVSTVHIFVYLFLALLVLRRSANHN